MYNIKRRQQVWRQCVDLPPISISTVLLKLHQSTLSALPRSILSSSIEETELKCFIDDFTKWWGRYRDDIIGMILSGCWKIITPSSQFRVLASFAAFSWKTNPDSLNRETPSWQYDEAIIRCSNSESKIVSMQTGMSLCKRNMQSNTQVDARFNIKINLIKILHSTTKLCHALSLGIISDSVWRSLCGEISFHRTHQHNKMDCYQPGKKKEKFYFVLFGMDINREA